MNSIFRTILLGAAVILVYDTLTAIVSATTGVSYGLFSIGSFAIYILFGFLVGRRSRWPWGVLAGALIALVETTIGWAISWSLGPGRPSAEVGPMAVIAVIPLVVLFGAVFGLIGGLLSLIVGRNA